jgi:hypothetical protein
MKILEKSTLDTNLKVTETPTESSFADIIAGDNVINIPLFQREYKWTNKNLIQFWLDIEAIIDGSKKSQFLGVVVTVPQPRPMGTPPINDIVDGQQRLFTCYLAIAAAVKVALDLGEKNWALEASRSYLLLRQHSNYETNTKIVPAAADRQQFQLIWTGISNHKSVDTSDWATIGVPTPPAPSGNVTGRLLTQYKNLLRNFYKVEKEGGFAQIKLIVEILVNSLSFVSISLRDPIAAPIIFERLNSRGENITTADLVRNEIFARVASNPIDAMNMFKNYWEPFQKKYDERVISLEILLFPYGLALDHTITKAELFQKLRDHWSTIPSTPEVIEDLDRFSSILFALELGEPSVDIPDELLECLLRFYRLNLPTSIYTFIFSCVEAVKQGKQNLKGVVDGFNVIEGFLVRRAVGGIEPTGLHAVFKGMYSEITKNVDYDSEITAKSIESELLKRSTLPWPDDEQFKQDLKNGDLYSRRICKYIIHEYELYSGGESPSDGFWVEHVLPQSITKKWSVDFDDASHQIWKNTFANLIPLTAEMNGKAGQNEYSKKKVEYKGSIFSSSRNFADVFDSWDLPSIEARAEELGNWGIARWPKSSV